MLLQRLPGLYTIHLWLQYHSLLSFRLRKRHSCAQERHTAAAGIAFCAGTTDPMADVKLRPVSLRPGGGAGSNPFAQFGKGAASKSAAVKQQVRH